MDWRTRFWLTALIAEWIFTLHVLVGLTVYVRKRELIAIFLPYHWFQFSALCFFAILTFCDGMAGTLRMWELYRFGRL